MVIRSHRGLRLEVTSRPMSGPLVPGGRGFAGLYAALLVAAGALLVALLVVPTVLTAGSALGSPRWLHLGHLARVFTDQDSRRAFLNTIGWLVVALVLVLVGFWIALLSRRLGRWSVVFVNVLMLPFGLSALASGAAFRIIFDPAPERGTATALLTYLFGGSPVWLGPWWVWWVLVSAFAWTWLGFVVSLFRAGLEAIPPELIRRARLQGPTGWLDGVWRLQWRMLRPVTAVVVLTLLVAAARIFDLVLIVVPVPMQDEVDVVSVRWWRLTTSATEQGEPAAIALVLLAVVAAAALAARKGMRIPHGVPQPPPPWWRRQLLAGWRRRVPWLSGTVGIAVGLLWAFPLFVLVATAVREPGDAGLLGWWQPASHLLSLASLAEVWNAGLPGALLGTLGVATGSALLVVSIAVVPAHALAAGVVRGRALTVVLAVLSVLAVLPVQMYVGPLRQAFTAVGLSGSRLPLVMMHAAAGLPFAILLLRAALSAGNEGRYADALGGLTGYRTGATRVWRTTGPALVAVAVVEFVLVWDDFIVSFLVSGPGASPLTLVLWGEARQFATSTGPVAAAAVVSAAVPSILLLLTWRRWVVPGLTGGVLR
ncbi:sugar ABC transporter permease [Actinopolymorpha sp. NPDC004070]|uniref:sugar ABC transporter permease n=1 Tax=Actinopolymorpha sp. NPDC004070 TaxID=3154548 RepID=UPI0033A17194